MEKYALSIEGMTCPSCEARVSKAISSVPGIGNLEVNLEEGNATFELSGQDSSLDSVIKAVEQAGYGARVGKKFDWIYVWGFFLLFALMPLSHRLGAGRILEDASYGMLFAIGLLTSIHCVGMCGGITLSQVADGESFRNRAFTLGKYNLSRVFAYTLVGAILGGIGAFVTPSPALKGLLLLAGGIGIGLFALAGIAPRWFGKVRMPDFIKGRQQTGRSNSWMVGFLNGFVPCPPLQGMQLFALASGSALKGGLSMLFFSLGTIPLLLGFGTFVTLLSPRWRSRLVKLGLMFMVLLGVMMIMRGISAIVRG